MEQNLDVGGDKKLKINFMWPNIVTKSKLQRLHAEIKQERAQVQG